MKCKRWTDEEKQFIGEACKTYTNAELGKAIGVSAGSVRYQLMKMGVVRGLKKWTKKELNWVRKHARIGIKALAAHFNVGNAQIIGMLKNHNIQTGNDCRFKKGQTPFNKGKKIETWMKPEMIASLKKTCFKKGQLPHNTLYDGAIRVRKDKTGASYQYIRLAKGKWELLQREVWRQHFGEIPEGRLITFKDGNTMNCNPTNLRLMDRQANMVRNTIHRYPVEVKQAIRVIGKLKRKIKTYEKQD